MGIDAADWDDVRLNIIGIGVFVSLNKKKKFTVSLTR